MGSKAFSIVVITRNRLTLLQRTLPPLVEYVNSKENGEIIIVDNASEDGSNEFMLSMCSRSPRMQVITNIENVGVARARNIGIRCTNNPIVISLDDDILIESDSLDRAIDAMSLYPRAGIIAAVVKEYGLNWLHNGVDIESSDSVIQVANHCGAFGIFKKSAIMEAGLLDEEGFFGAEERSLAIKVRALGYDVLLVANIIGYHIDTIDRSRPNIFRYKMRVYNNVRLNFKYFSTLDASVISLRYLITMLYSGRKLFPMGTFKMIISFMNGVYCGISTRAQIPVEVQRFYLAKNTQPGFGNTPLSHRLRQKYGKRSEA